MKGWSLLGALIVLGLPLSAQEPGSAGREKVLGIGGLFFRARDPAALALWYERHLGVALTPSSYDQQPWRQEAGPTVFAPFPDTTGYFGARDRVWMVNFRVRDLAAMVAQLRASGIAVEVDPKLYPNGRFARLHDPEGNPIELWEPQARGVPQ
jgi:predicted enzyme related to lactoylglutathione lyase